VSDIDSLAAAGQNYTTYIREDNGKAVTIPTGMDLARIIHDSFCCKLAFFAPRVFRPRCSLRRTGSAPHCAAPGASAIRFGNRAFATKSRE
jgi:hypothetical protein